LQAPDFDQQAEARTVAIGQVGGIDDKFRRFQGGKLINNRVSDIAEGNYIESRLQYHSGYIVDFSCQRICAVFVHWIYCPAVLPHPLPP
jgi:hypothetical protein